MSSKWYRAYVDKISALLKYIIIHCISCTKDGLFVSYIVWRGGGGNGPPLGIFYSYEFSLCTILVQLFLYTITKIVFADVCIFIMTLSSPKYPHLFPSYHVIIILYIFIIIENVVSTDRQYLCNLSTILEKKL